SSSSFLTVKTCRKYSQYGKMCAIICKCMIEPIGKESLMLGKKVKLCDMEGHPVANAIIMSLDKSKMVMDKSLGEEYFEVAILFVYKPNAPLFVKDNERKTVQDAVGSHIVWFIDFVELDDT
ncbi:hypothetical protein Taro_001610, partial [Colocasia esculenta]|nr:hypothetical protein [Colocasia esculenta]